MECEVWIVVAASPIDTVKAQTRECRSLKTSMSCETSAALPMRFPKNAQQDTSEVLRLPRKMKMDTSKVLRLP